ncbi:MAG: GGDEF/EAL domain-containing response regulator [Methylomonas sp.]
MEKVDRFQPNQQSTILIVDDTRSTQEVLVSLLSQYYQVKVAGNGLQALEIAEDSPRPDLILLDVNMPDMDGYEVCRRLQSNPLTRDIAVMFVSAPSDPESESLGLELGAVDYISKPISPIITLLRVRNYLLLKQALDKLRLTAKIFENILESIVITDARGYILDVNPAFCRLTGYTRAESIGRTSEFLHADFQDKAFYAEMWRAISTDGYWSGEIWNRTKEGGVYPELISISAITDAHGAVTHYVGISSDITLLKEHEKQLEHIAHYDALTGIPNRLLLADRMKQNIAQAKRENNMLGVCYLDLDGFKPINDGFGHLIGDRVLVQIARLISDALRECDTVARLGGDEFVVLLPGFHQVEECISAVTRLHEIISQPIQLEGQSFSLTASIGVSIFPNDDNDPDVLLRHADQSMYIAKKSGKNAYHLYDPDSDRQTHAHHELLLRIDQGLESEEFELYYQPKVDLINRELVGAEALIRWNHPERGLLLPGEFLHEIHNTELESKLGEWVLDAALRQCTQWFDAGMELDVSVNIAGHHLQSQGFVEYMKHMFTAYPNMPPGNLHIEILETAALEDFAKVTATIEACRELGARFALDDFGTGYSSLTYIQRLPIDTLKIDYSFVRDMLVDKGDNAIVQGVIALAKAFGQKTVAEGIETLAHLQALLAMGCEFGQGFGIARPMAAPDFMVWAQNKGIPDSQQVL